MQILPYWEVKDIDVLMELSYIDTYSIITELKMNSLLQCLDCEVSGAGLPLMNSSERTSITEFSKAPPIIQKVCQTESYYMLYTCG